jgi:hypothetical protein
MTHEEIHEAVRKVAAYAKELGLHPEMIYWNADDPEQGASDPEELVEDVHDKVEVNEGIVFRDAYTVERKWENPDCDDTVAVYSSNVKGDASARWTLIQLESFSPSHPPACSVFVGCRTKSQSRLYRMEEVVD